MEQQKRDMGAIKAAAKRQFGHIEGIEGFGIGDNTLRIYVTDASMRDRLPIEFQGVPVDLVVTGEITAARSSVAS
jgi:hypothetical protein